MCLLADAATCTFAGPITGLCGGLFPQHWYGIEWRWRMRRTGNTFGRLATAMASETPIQNGPNRNSIVHC
jgi:hypothetical protein